MPPTQTVEEAITALEAAVTEEETVDASAEKLVADLAALYAASKNDPARIQAITDRVLAAKGKLSDAVTANTPAE